MSWNKFCYHFLFEPFSSFVVFDGLDVWVIMVLLRTLNDIVGAAEVLLGGFDVGAMIVLLGTLNDVVGSAVVLFGGFNVGFMIVMLGTLNDVVGSAVVLLGGLDARTTTHSLFEKTSMDTTD